MPEDYIKHVMSQSVPNNDNPQVQTETEVEVVSTNNLPLKGESIQSITQEFSINVNKDQ